MPTFRTWRLRPPRRSSTRQAPLRLRVRLALARHRRVVVATLVAAAVVAGLQSLRPARPPTADVLVSVRDLPAGHRLTARDLTPRAWPVEVVPAGLVPRPHGRVLATPLRRGEPVTDVRVTSSGRGTPGGRLPAGWVAATVRLTDPAAALLVSPGDQVEVIAGAATDPISGGAATGTEASRSARVVVEDAVVLATPRRNAPVEGGVGGGSGRGLLNAFGGSGTTTPTEAGSDRQGGDEPDGYNGGDDGAEDRGAGALPAGVLVLGVPGVGALDLAAVSGTRFLTVARLIPGPDR